MTPAEFAALDAQLVKLAKFIESLREPPVAAASLQPARTDARAVLAPPSQLVRAVGWLHATLAYGPIPARLVYADAFLAGIARRTLERAKRVLGVRSEVSRRSIRHLWQWRLPDPRRDG